MAQYSEIPRVAYTVEPSNFSQILDELSCQYHFFLWEAIILVVIVLLYANSYFYITILADCFAKKSLTKHSCHEKHN